ncbi:biopolymer transporter ExbD [Ketobacter sp. MCCC 1A13808]|uniref:ExbD/TolR family protein n=1 Tax=Ketobacter sp. MCCC 1A13808 TaxID=2602738 RepID=UPI000F295CC7|nr:biopolymer transporter ExbD [Ketobacter sp. MCCC 1A13808]MVF14731.1 biopolymer transporter ExbD [Ketobacter sp. MCCC 1A13808]RLP55921.1 MAG: biopolymer transporter ExbD [Ketobacter sp.]
MDILKSRRHKARSMDEQLIPLINIVFLLLIFFMIAGQIRQSQNQHIVPPESKSEKPLVRPQVLVEMDSDLKISLNGESVALDSLPESLSLLPDVQHQSVAVKADHTIHAQDIDELFNVLREQGITHITLYSKRGV